MGVLFRIMFMDIVPATRKNGQFPTGKVVVEGESLFNFKEIAPVGIHYKGRAGDGLEQPPQVKGFSAV